MGEAKQRELVVRQQVVEALGLETANGLLKVRWDGTAQATALGQMAFFIEFLTVTGLFDQWVEDCPLDYKSPNGSSRREILGTWLLSILSGHWRYAHVSTIRADGVNPRLLGMKGVVAEDTVRRALKAIDETLGRGWRSRHLGRTVLGLLEAPWILDVDVTIKPVYGKQQGAVLGYNPHKPGRPSHAYHSYQVCGLRLMLGVDVLAGNESHARDTLPGLIKLLDSFRIFDSNGLYVIFPEDLGRYLRPTPINVIRWIGNKQPRPVRSSLNAGAKAAEACVRWSRCFVRLRSADRVICLSCG